MSDWLTASFLHVQRARLESLGGHMRSLDRSLPTPVLRSPYLTLVLTACIWSGTELSAGVKSTWIPVRFPAADEHQGDRSMSSSLVLPPVSCEISWAALVSLMCSLQARVAHSRHRVFPVPVGLSRTPFFFCNTKSVRASCCDVGLKWFIIIHYSRRPGAII